MQEWWQHLPLTLHPTAVTVGFFSVSWYGIFFLLGFAAAFSFGYFLVKKERLAISSEELFDLFVLLFFGALLGARLGFAFFYFPNLLFVHPLAFFSPYDFMTRQWTGIAGMSFHGGLIGVLAALIWFVKKRKFSFWFVADILALAAPLTLFFGRLGNFWNGELYGRVTTKPWGMFFPGAEPALLLRHPSSLYEAFLEGVVLFLALLYIRSRTTTPGVLASFFLLGYATVRFFVEYVREPDQGVPLYFTLTRGQLLSLIMFFCGLTILFWLKGGKYVIIARKH